MHCGHQSSTVSRRAWPGSRCTQPHLLSASMPNPHTVTSLHKTSTYPHDHIRLILNMSHRIGTSASPPTNSNSHANSSTASKHSDTPPRQTTTTIFSTQTHHPTNQQTQPAEHQTQTATPTPGSSSKTTTFTLSSSLHQTSSQISNPHPPAQIPTKHTQASNTAPKTKSPTPAESTSPARYSSKEIGPT